jgi:ribosome maturation factor RimP
VEGRRNWDGTLAGLEDDQVVVEIAPGKTMRFPLSEIHKANLKFEW